MWKVLVPLGFRILSVGVHLIGKKRKKGLVSGRTESRDRGEMTEGNAQFRCRGSRFYGKEGDVGMNSKKEVGSGMIMLIMLRSGIGIIGHEEAANLGIE